jgi:hypothetical protein
LPAAGVGDSEGAKVKNEDELAEAGSVKKLTISA